MPSLIEEYMQSLLNTAAASPIVSASSIVLDKRTNRSGLIRGDLYFSDNTHLHFRELIDHQEKVARLMYSYHYQSGENNLIFRYDDTPHHPELTGFPHHKHIGVEGVVMAPEPPGLAEVLAEIESNFPLGRR